MITYNCELCDFHAFLQHMFLNFTCFQCHHILDELHIKNQKINDSNFWNLGNFFFTYTVVDALLAHAPRNLVEQLIIGLKPQKLILIPCYMGSPQNSNSIRRSIHGIKVPKMWRTENNHGYYIAHVHNLLYIYIYSFQGEFYYWQRNSESLYMYLELIRHPGLFCTS